MFDFIRCYEGKDALRQLVEKEEYYQYMEEDAKVIAEIDDSLVEAAWKRMGK